MKIKQNLNVSSIKQWVYKYGALPVLLLLVIIASTMSDAFFTSQNLLNVLRQVSANGIVSIGLTFVILTAGIDISVGSVVGISSILFAAAYQPTALVPPYEVIAKFMNLMIPNNPYIGVLIISIVVMLIEVFLGFINGLGVSKGGLPPFIMTMGTMTLFRGIALLLCNGKPLYMDAEYAKQINWFGGGRIFFEIPVPVVVFIVVAIIASTVLNRTTFGRYIRAIGGNQEAARVAGISISRHKMMAYGICSALAALAGIITTTRTTTGEPMLGTSWELDAIAAVVIGGTRLTGGVGTISGTVLGAIIIGVINNMLNLANVSSYYQYVVKGLIIILAVLFRSQKER